MSYPVCACTDPQWDDLGLPFTCLPSWPVCSFCSGEYPSKDNIRAWHAGPWEKDQPFWALWYKYAPLLYRLDRERRWWGDPLWGCADFT